MNNLQGFTSVELLIMLTIMGMLSIIAIPIYRNYMKKAQFSHIAQYI
jgi:Tfp pilus assembly protein PilE